MGALCIIYAIQNPGSRILAVRGTQSKISESSLQILKDVIDMMNISDYFDITEHTLECKNGSKFLFYGAKNYQSFKSLQGIDLVFVDEATELSEKAWEALIPTIRTDNSKFLIAFNPDKLDDWCFDNFITNNHPRAYVTKLNYPDNPYFPEVLKEEMEYDKQKNYPKYLNIWEGNIKETGEDALFKYEHIKKVPAERELEIYSNMDRTFDKIVVSIDPSGSSNSTSDACGIMVVGRFEKTDEYCILEDATKICSPSEWVKKAISLYYKYDANCVLYESNYGGDIVDSLIKTIDNRVAIKSVRAKKGKALRAEPVVALYEQGKVHHCSGLGILEHEMTSYCGGKNEKSPNALDAMVYGVMHLAGNKTEMSSTTFKLY